jgi:hypothetical protein
MNAWLPKNSNLTQAKIFLLRKNISFGLGLNFWHVRPSGNVIFFKKSCCLNFWLVRQDMKYIFYLSL